MKKILLFIILLTSLSFGQGGELILFDDGVTYSVEANAFFAATGITDKTQRAAVDYLVTALKDNNLWDSLYAIYPIVGGTATTHKYNLKDPRDLDAAYRLTFGGTVAHSSLGLVPTNGYANTHFNPSTSMVLNRSSVGVYTMDMKTPSATKIIGCTDGNVDHRWYILLSNEISKLSSAMYNSNTGQGFLSSETITSKMFGLFITTRSASNLHQVIINGIKNGESTTSGGALPNQDFYFLAYNNNGTPAYYDDHTVSFAFIGKGLSEAQSILLNTIVENYQDRLNRKPLVLWFEGNSITAGYTAGGDTSNYVTKMMRKFIEPTMWVNDAVSGDMLTTMVSQGASHFDNLKYPGQTNILVVLGGVNDMRNQHDTSATIIYNRLKTFCAARTAAGFVVVALTLLPQSIAPERPNYEADRQTFNNLVKTDLITSGAAYAYIDIGSDPVMGVAGSELNTTYYKDLIHPSDTGQEYLATIIYNGLRALGF